MATTKEYHLQEKKNDKFKYPKLMIHVETSRIVLFTSDCVGTVVSEGTGCNIDNIVDSHE
jgi:hypothetical protein